MEELLQRQAALPYDFPPGTEAVQLSSFKAREAEVLDLASKVGPLAPAGLQRLLESWLKAKQQHGSEVEKDLYQNMTAEDLFTRLLHKRPISFWGNGDRYILPTTQNQRQLQSQQWGGFDEIGTCQEMQPLLLRDYLSYDEMQISAMISVAVPTLFINCGGRDSLCQPGKPGSFEEKGIMVACVGARMVVPGRMEAAHMVISAGSSARSPVTEAWEEFYGLRLAELSDAEADTTGQRFHRIGADCSHCWQRCEEVWTHGTGRKERKYCRACMTSYYGRPPSWPPDAASYLDKEMYQLRIHQSIWPFLAYACSLGQQHKQATAGRLGAHARVKGLGLGAWWIDPVQEPLMYRVYERILREEDLKGIDVLDFAYFPSALPESLIIAGAKQGIQVIDSKSGFADPVHGRLLVAMYAWDANAHPGNEWWAENGGRNYLGMTDDSAAASCSLISSLQHPSINGERLCFGAASFF